MSPEDQARMKEQMQARREERQQYWQGLSPDERQQIREEHRERWQSMSPEEQAGARDRWNSRKRLHDGSGASGQGGGRGGN